MRHELNLQRTKEHIPLIPLGPAALHTGNTRLLHLCELTTNIIHVTLSHSDVSGYEPESNSSRHAESETLQFNTGTI